MHPCVRLLLLCLVVSVCGANHALAYSRSDVPREAPESRPFTGQDEARALFNTGVMFDRGRGVPQDYAEAVRWYRLAAEQGLAEAQYNLGQMFAQGYGVTKDSAMAVYWYRLAAQQGLAAAQFNLGMRYYRGNGVRQDYGQAREWFRLAAEQGDSQA